jgi:hypothetical protein
MSDAGGGALIPVSDEQAKAIQEALKALQGVGGFLREVVGTVPEDLVGYLGGDWLRVRRAENLAHMIEKMRERLKARKVEAGEPPSISIALPLLIAAADESRDELQDLWARLLAAATDPTRARSFRIQFIEAAKQMDPLDAVVLDAAGRVPLMSGQIRNDLAEKLNTTPDEIELSQENLARMRLLATVPGSTYHTTPFGREFLRAIAD